MPESPPVPAVKYIRYSSEMQRDGYSVEYQDRALDEWAERNGRVIVGRYVDEAESGTTHNREAFQKLLAECRRKDRGFVEVAVFHTWRFSRSMDDAPLFSELERHGVTVRSATEQIDTSTASGKFQRNISLAVGAYQVDQLREATSQGKQQRVRGKAGKGGRSNSSASPFGYMRINGMDTPDMRVINVGEAEPRSNWDGAQLFKRLLLEGHTDLQTAVELNRQGYRTTGNWGRRPFSKDTITGMARNAFYAGKISYRGLSKAKNEAGQRKRNTKREVQWFEGEHTPLFTPDEWEQVQRIRLARRKHGGGHPPRRIYLLERRACATCGEPMRAKYLTDGSLAYACTARERGLDCAAPQSPVRERVIEPQIDALIGALELPESIGLQALELIERGDLQADVETRRAELLGERKRLLVQHQKGYIADQVLDVEMGRIETELQELTVPDQPTTMQAVSDLRRMVDAWRGATPQDKREMLSTLLDHAEIDTKTKQVVAFVPRTEFWALFEAASLSRSKKGYLP